MNKLIMHYIMKNRFLSSHFNEKKEGNNYLCKIEIFRVSQKMSVNKKVIQHVNGIFSGIRGITKL